MKKSNTSLVVSLVSIVAGMTLLAYASVPLYRLFCAVTGFGGTPMRAEDISTTIIDRTFNVRFNADISKDLPWEFAAEEKNIPLKVGENRLTTYRVKNNASERLTGHATYNVLPEEVGPYFMKIQCFCFQDQTLAAQEEAHMPISFFIDPAIMEDPNLRDLKTITLSYTFFPSKSETNTQN